MPLSVIEVQDTEAVYRDVLSRLDAFRGNSVGDFNNGFLLDTPLAILTKRLAHCIEASARDGDHERKAAYLALRGALLSLCGGPQVTGFACYERARCDPEGFASAGARVREHGIALGWVVADAIATESEGDGEGSGEEDVAAIDDVDEGEAVFRKEGDTWTVRFGEERKSGLKDLKGMRYIHTLVRDPMTRIPALQLTGCEVPPELMESGCAADPILDDQAKQELVRKIRDLDEGIEDASGNNDFAQVERLKLKREALNDELRKSMGLGSRDRLLGGRSAADKAADSVRQALKSAYNLLAQHGLERLATYLKDSVKRDGTTFAYRPSKLPAP